MKCFMAVLWSLALGGWIGTLVTEHKVSVGEVEVWFNGDGWVFEEEDFTRLRGMSGLRRIRIDADDYFKPKVIHSSKPIVKYYVKHVYMVPGADGRWVEVPEQRGYLRTSVDPNFPSK